MEVIQVFYLVSWFLAYLCLVQLGKIFFSFFFKEILLFSEYADY